MAHPLETQASQTTTATLDPIPRAQRLFRALSDETRLKILSLLAGGERCVCELSDSVGAAQSRLSFHLRVLKDVGMVTDRRDGRWIYYQVNRDALAEVTGLVNQLEEGFPDWPNIGGCCRG